MLVVLMIASVMWTEFENHNSKVSFPDSRCLFSLVFARLTRKMKIDLCGPHLERCSSNRMLHCIFADCDLSPLCPALPFAFIPLLFSDPTQHEVPREGSVAK